MKVLVTGRIKRRRNEVSNLLSEVLEIPFKKLNSYSISFIRFTVRRKENSPVLLRITEMLEIK